MWHGAPHTEYTKSTVLTPSPPVVKTARLKQHIIYHRRMQLLTKTHNLGGQKARRKRRHRSCPAISRGGKRGRPHRSGRTARAGGAPCAPDAIDGSLTHSPQKLSHVYVPPACAMCLDNNDFGTQHYTVYGQRGTATPHSRGRRDERIGRQPYRQSPPQCGQRTTVGVADTRTGP